MPLDEYRRLSTWKSLTSLDAVRVRDDLIRLADGRIPVLCCFERPGRGQWCHRAIAAQWLAEALGLQVPEVGFETCTRSLHRTRRAKLPLPQGFTA